MLLPPHRTPAGYRRYPADAVARVALIQRALAVGFSLDELARVLKQRDKGGAPCREVYRLVTEKLGEVDRQVAEFDGAAARPEGSAEGMGGEGSTTRLRGNAPICSSRCRSARQPALRADAEDSTIDRQPSPPVKGHSPAP